MADRKYYVICELGCRFESMTKEQIITAIMQAVNEGTIGNIDAGFITTIKTINDKAVRFFYGTQAEYNALEDKENLFAVITDDTTVEAFNKAIEELQKTVADHSRKLIEIAPYSLVQPDENGDFPLEIGKTYKVFFTHQSGHSGDMLKAAYYLKPSIFGGEEEFITITNSISYSQYESINYFTITLLAVDIRSSGYGQIKVVYSVNGEEITWYALSEDAKQYLNGNKPVTMSITGATKCLLQNDEPYLR